MNKRIWVSLKSAKTFPVVSANIALVLSRTDDDGTVFQISLCGNHTNPYS